MTSSEEQDHAKAGYRLERLALYGFGVSISKRDDMIEVRCHNVKVQSGVGATLGDALDVFLDNMKQAGWRV